MCNRDAAAKTRACGGSVRCTRMSATTAAVRVRWGPMRRHLMGKTRRHHATSALWREMKCRSAAAGCVSALLWHKNKFESNAVPAMERKSIQQRQANSG
jgi:hypothetical protein